MMSSKVRLHSYEIVKNMESLFADKVEWESGWLHQFVCDKCSSQLDFNVNPDSYKQNLYKCPRCGHSYSGKVYQNAWVYQYRRWFSDRMMNVAVCQDSNEAIGFLQRYLSFYSYHYKDFPIHGEHVGLGKIMSQSLDESVFGIGLLRTIDYCKDKIGTNTFLICRDGLFKPMADLLIPQVQSIHNISIWIQCCIGMIGLVFDDENLVSTALYGEYGLLQQLDRGLTNDGLWYEGSLHYHYYVLSALTSFCDLLRKRNPKHELISMMVKMYKAPLWLSPDGWNLPSFNDGWFPISFETYGSQIIQAAYMTQDSELLEQAKRIIIQCPYLETEPEVALLTKSMQDIRLCFEGHIAVINRPFRMIMKSGSIVSTHSHKDCLSITIDPLSRDLGTPGYGSPINNSWYRNSLSHNSISIDGTQQTFSGKNRCEIINNGVKAYAFEDNPDILEAARTLYIFDDYIEDKVHIKTKKEHVIEWTFHGNGKAYYKARSHSVASLGKQAPYQLFRNVKQIVCCNSLTITFHCKEDTMLEIKIPISNDMQMFIGETPGNPSDQNRTSILVRIIGSEALFLATYRMKTRTKKAHLWKNLLGG